MIDDDTLGEEEIFAFQPDDPLTYRYDADPQTKYRVEVLAYNEMGDGQDSVEEPTTALEGRKLLNVLVICYMLHEQFRKFDFLRVSGVEYKLHLVLIWFRLRGM